MTTTNPRAAIGGNNPPSAEEILKERHAALFGRKAAYDKQFKKLKDFTPETLDDCIKIEALFADARDLVNDADDARAKEKEPHLEAGRQVDNFFNVNFRDAIGTDRKKGGPAVSLLQRASDRRLAITREEQAREAEKAEALRKEAEKAASKAAAQEERGQFRAADVSTAQAESLEHTAQAAEVRANQDVSQASKSSAGGITSSVKVEHVVTGIIRAKLDLESLRLFIKEEALIAAVQAYLRQTGEKSFDGAHVEERAKGNVRR